jgi:hypothetical protein
VREPVEEGRGHAIIGKDRIPIAKAQITRDNHGNLFIEITNQGQDRMKATTISVPSSHASIVSHPFQVFELIQAAAKVGATRE